MFYNFHRDLEISELLQKEIMEEIKKYLSKKGFYADIVEPNNKDNKFDFIIKYFPKNNNHIIRQSSFELKDDFLTKDTGNLFVEYYCNGKPSGISISNADFYVFSVRKTDIRKADIFIIKTTKLKELIKQVKPNIVKGGDNNASKGFLLPYSTFKQYEHVTYICEYTSSLLTTTMAGVL